MAGNSLDRNRVAGDQAADRSVWQNGFLVSDDLEIREEVGQFSGGEDERRVLQVIVVAVTLARSKGFVDQQPAGSQGFGDQAGQAAPVEKAEYNDQVVDVL